jgi:hypothetical protein
MAATIRGVGPETGGVMLILTGLAFTLERFTSVERVWQWLPLFVIFLAARDLRRLPAADRTMLPLLFGIWLQISALDFFGFNFLNSWPLLVTLMGLGLVIDGIVRGIHAEREIPQGDR